MHFKYRKESKEYCPKMSPIFGHSLPSVMGCDCPAQGLSMPTWWATDARVTGTSRPTEGHRGTCGLNRGTCGLKHFIQSIGRFYFILSNRLDEIPFF